MTASITVRATRWRRLLAAAAGAATATVLLAAPTPANAGVTSPGTPSSSAVAGDVLFWSSSATEGYNEDKSILKASAAAPTLTATVLASSEAPYVAFAGPEVSPNGTKLAYIRYALATRTLEVRDLATGATTVLVTGAGERVGEPTWSPDGQTIAYVDGTSVEPHYYSEVKVVPASGGPSTLVDPSAVAAAWRPDGKLIVARFTDQPRTYDGLWITGATPNDAMLIPGSVGARDFAWSPDGTQVAFSKASGMYDTSIYTLPAAGGAPTAIVPVEDYELNAAPVWSSDSQRVYFTHQTSTGIPGGPSSIMQVSRTGGAVSLLAGGRYFSPSVTSQVAAPVPSASHDFNGDGYADVIGRTTNGDLRLYFGNGLGLSGYRRIGTGWGSLTAIFSPGDFNSDGHPDVIGRTSNGDLRVYFGNGTGLAGYAVIGTRWSGFSALFSPGDFNGDGHPDVIGRTQTGDLRLYVGTGTRLTGGTVIGTSWNGFSALFSPGDFNADGKPDVIGRTQTGELRLYHGTGSRLSGYQIIGTGWNGFSALFSPGDFNLDGKPDTIGRTSNGDLRVYYSNGTRLSGYRVIGTGWNGLNPLL